MRDHFMRLPNTMALTGSSRSKLYADIKNKTFPPQISIGSRAVAWLSSEIDAWLTARAAGVSEDDLRDLVARLIKERAERVQIKAFQVRSNSTEVPVERNLR